MRKHFMSQNRILHVQKNLVVLPSNDYAMHIRSIYSQTQNFVMKIKQRTLNTNFLVNPFKRIYVIEYQNMSLRNCTQNPPKALLHDDTQQILFC